MYRKTDCQVLITMWITYQFYTRFKGQSNPMLKTANSEFVGIRSCSAGRFRRCGAVDRTLSYIYTLECSLCALVNNTMDSRAIVTLMNWTVQQKNANWKSFCEHRMPAPCTMPFTNDNACSAVTATNSRGRGTQRDHVRHCYDSFNVQLSLYWLIIISVSNV